MIFMWFMAGLFVLIYEERKMSYLMFSIYDCTYFKDSLNMCWKEIIVNTHHFARFEEIGAH